MLKERPILFNGDMVRALLDGRKTQTRRVIKQQPTVHVDHFRHVSRCAKTGRMDWQACDKAGKPVHAFKKKPCFVSEIAQCPYGQPGDRLWVRETHFVNGMVCDDEPYPEVTYRADPLPCWEGEEQDIRWTPSIFMPRWASRITLEIVSVRVERLQDISENDAQNEGAFFTDYGRQCFHYGAPRDVGQCPAAEEHHPKRAGWSMHPTTSHEQCLLTARTAFANLWGAINGTESWEANPWVWVVEFKRVEAIQ